MPEWGFFAAWLVPIVFIGVTMLRVAVRVRSVVNNLQDPEALAESVREVLEDSPRFQDAQRRAGEVTVETSEIAPADPGMPDLPRPYDASGGTSALKWAALLVIAGAIAVIWLVL